MLQLIILAYLINWCGAAQDYDAPFFRGKNVFHRMTALSRQIYDDAVRRALELNEIREVEKVGHSGFLFHSNLEQPDWGRTSTLQKIAEPNNTVFNGVVFLRFLYEVSPEYETGYIMGEIIERYRKLMEEGRMAYVNLQNKYHFRAHYATDLLLRIEKAQHLYFEAYHLVRMMHEIGPKYATYMKVHGNYDAMFDNPNAPKGNAAGKGPGGKGGKQPPGKGAPGKGPPGKGPADAAALAQLAGGAKEEVDPDDAYYDQMVNAVDEVGADGAISAGGPSVNASVNGTNNTNGIDYAGVPMYGQGMVVYPTPPPIKKYDHDAEAKKRKEAALQKEAERKAREEAYRLQVLQKIQDQQFIAEAQKHAYYGYEYVHAYTQIPTMYGQVAMDSRGSVDDLVDDPGEKKNKQGETLSSKKRKKKPLTPFDYGWMLDTFEY